MPSWLPSDTLRDTTDAEDSPRQPGCLWAEALEERGYTTVAFTCNPLIVPNKNFHQGFESFDSYHTFRKSDAVLDSIQGFMERHAGTRFFLYLHLVDPHEQYELSQSARERVWGE